MIRIAIPYAPISNIKNVACDAQCRSLLLDRPSEGRVVVLGCRFHVHRPALIGINVSRVHVKRSDVMFYRRSPIGRDHCAQKERP